MKQEKFKLVNSNHKGDFTKISNAFTLIELLAIIVILAIIAVITVPIILNIIDNSRKGAAIDSAYGYKDSVQKYYLSKVMEDTTEELPIGYKMVSALPEDFTVSGEAPSDGWIQLEKGQVVSYSLKFGDYVVTKYKDTDAIAVKNGNIEENEEARAARLEAERIAAAKQASNDAANAYVKAALAFYTGTLTSEESKYVSTMTTDGVTKPEGLLDTGWIHFDYDDSNGLYVKNYALKFGDYTSKYSSLTNGDYVSTVTEENEGQKPSVITVGSNVCLTETDCFKVIEINGTTATLLAKNNIDTSTGLQGSNGSSYPVAFAGSKYWESNDADIYDSTKNDESGTNYSVAYYINQYVENLKDLGFNVISGRILKHSEVNTGGIAASYKSSGESYWIGTANNDNYVKCWSSYGWMDSSVYSSSSTYGVRPIIYIGTSDI